MRAIKEHVEALKGSRRRSALPFPSKPSGLMSVATLMGPAFGKFATLMGPPFAGVRGPPRSDVT